MSAAALLAFAGLYQLRHLGVFEDMADAAMDRSMMLHADRPLTGGDLPEIGLVDFDDHTLAQQNDPVLIPAHDVATLLGRLAEQRPWAILIDLDISYFSDPRDIAEIRSALLILAETGRPVFLARGVAAPRPGDPRPQLRVSPFDDMVAGRPNLMWVGKQLYADPTDGMVRRLAVIECAVDPNARRRPAVAIPSATLAILLLRRLGDIGSVERSFTAAADAGRICDGAEATGTFAIETPQERLVIDVSEDNRINFTMLQQLNDRSRSAIGVINNRGRRSWFDGRLIVVGTTAAQRDAWHTPLGPMAGAAIHANAIRSWLSVGPDRGMRFWAGLLWAWGLTFFITAITLVPLLLVRKKATRERMRDWLPAMITGLVWFAFYLFGGSSNSLGGIILVYVVVHIVIIVERYFEYGNRRKTRSARRIPT